MNILQRAISAIATRTLPAGPPLTWDYFMGDRSESLAGITVNESTALNLSPVWSGVFQLSGDVAKLPLNHHRILPNGGKEIFVGKIHSMLHDRTNPEMTAFKFRECMQALCLLYGNAYAEIIRDVTGKAVWMYPIAPHRVDPIRERAYADDGTPNPRTGRLVYRVNQPSGGTTYVRPENMIHISSLSTDGVIGHSITDHGSESIGLGLAMEKFGAAFFGNGSTFGGVVELQQTLSGAQGEIVKSNIRSAIEAVHSGVERAHKILVLAGGAKFTQRGTPPNEAQFLETRKFQISEVSRWLVMPPHKLGDLENAHFTNIEESEIQYWKGTVHRWLKMWEQELRAKLISPLEQNQQSIDFNMEGELRGTSAQRAAFYKEMVGLGAYTINIVLEKEGLPTIGPAGDLHLVPLNMIPIEKYREYIDAQIGKMTQADPAPPKEIPAESDTAKEFEEGQRKILEAIAETRAAAQHMTDAVTAKLEAEVREHATTAESAKRAQAEAEAKAMSEEAARVRAQDEAQEALDEAAAARVALEEATAKLDAAQAAIVTAQADAQAKQAQIEAALADVAAKESAVLKAEALAMERTESATVAASTAAQAEEAAQRMAAEAERLKAELASAVEARDAEQARAAEAEAAVQAHQQAERARLTRVITAHRALIVDVVQRVARTEADRARRRASHPDQLRKWADAFYDESGRDICAEMLYPAIQTHLAWKGSDEDPRAVARAMADAYYSDSLQQIRTISEGMVGEEFQAAVTRMLARWEQERPQAVADKVVRDEIAALVSR